MTKPRIHVKSFLAKARMGWNYLNILRKQSIELRLEQGQSKLRARLCWPIDAYRAERIMRKKFPKKKFKR